MLFMSVSLRNYLPSTSYVDSGYQFRQPVAFILDLPGRYGIRSHTMLTVWGGNSSLGKCGRRGVTWFGVDLH